MKHIRGFTLADVLDLARDRYELVAPALGMHAPCREFCCVALGICAALDIECSLRFDPTYTEGGVVDQHYWLEFEDGRTVDLWQRKARLR